MANLSVSMNLPTLNISYELNYMICGFLCLAYFTLHNLLKVRPCCIYQFHSYLWLNSPLYVRTTFWYPFTCLWTFVVVSFTFLLWRIMLLWTLFPKYLLESLLSVLWDNIPKSGIDELCGNYAGVWGIAKLFSQRHTVSHNSSAEVFQFFHILYNTSFLSFLFF